MLAIKTVGVVGAGSMGQGIAQVAAQANLQVKLFDVDYSRVHKALSAIENNLSVAVTRGKITKEQKHAALQNISGCNTLSEVQANLIIEAAIENLAIKQEIFSSLEKTNNDTCILATNTSSLSVSKIASPLRNPEKFLGLHFFNPAHLMPLVEVVAGLKTDLNLISEMREFVTTIGKVPVVAKDSPGFIVNRVARHYYLEALKAYEDGAADVGTIDAVMKSAGFKLGPFELMDMIGNDVNYEVTRSLYEAFERAPRFKPSEVQHQKVLTGELGRKTGKGFYEYKM